MKTIWDCKSIFSFDSEYFNSFMKSQNTSLFTVSWYKEQIKLPFEQNAAIILTEPTIVWFIIAEVRPFGIQLYHDFVSLLKRSFVNIHY